MEEDSKEKKKGSLLKVNAEEGAGSVRKWKKTKRRKKRDALIKVNTGRQKGAYAGFPLSDLAHR